MDWEWPDELDALVAAPAHHTLLLENERVRVLETRIPAGEKQEFTRTAGRTSSTC